MDNRPRGSPKSISVPALYTNKSGRNSLKENFKELCNIKIQYKNEVKSRNFKQMKQ